MTKLLCDVCGCEMSKEAKNVGFLFSPKTGTPTEHIGYYTTVHDCCARCYEIGKRIKVPEALFDIWRKQVHDDIGETANQDMGT